MTDIVERLRKPASYLRMVKGDDGYEIAYCPLCQEAADEIERLKAALRMAHRFLSEHDLSSTLSATALIEASEAEDTARAALEGKDE